MQSLSKYNKGIKCLLCAIDLVIKYVWVVPIKDKKGVTIANAFKKKYLMIQIENQRKYGLMKVVNFVIILLRIF